MNIPSPGKAYDRQNEMVFRDEVRRADFENVKLGADVRFQRGERVVLMSPNGSLWALSASNAGVLSLVSYP